MVGRVTVTHLDGTRYFITVHEACQPVIQAAAIGSDGEALVLDIGEPVRIDDVARQLIAQSGREIDIVHTGLRDGETLYEVLISEAEHDHRPHHGPITHVDVPPLGAKVMLEVNPDFDAQVARTTLRQWCENDPELPQSGGPEAPAAETRKVSTPR